MPNVTFLYAVHIDADTGRISVCYACVDTIVGLAFATVDTLLDYEKTYPLDE